jgi:hypothetical protein
MESYSRIPPFSNKEKESQREIGLAPYIFSKGILDTMYGRIVV